MADVLTSRRARLARGIRENIKRAPVGGLFWWTILITVLAVLVVASWFFSIFVFAHPEMPRNYALLNRLEKLDPIKKFEPLSPPRGRFRTARTLYERYHRYNEFLLKEVNSLLKRDYIENYKRADIIEYAKGEFIVDAARRLTENDVFTDGVIVFARSAVYPKISIEYILCGKSDKITPEAFPTGSSLFAGPRNSGPADFSTIIHVERFNEDDLRLTLVPLIYRYIVSDELVLNLEPPETLNMGASWPLMTEQDRIASKQGTVAEASPEPSGA